MNNTRTGHFPVANSDGWVNLGDALAAVSDFATMPRSMDKIRFRVPDDQSNLIQIGITGNHATEPADDKATNFLPIGEPRTYETVNLDLVWVQAPDGDSVIEFDGNPS